jgi:hypothetical protein
MSQVGILLGPPTQSVSLLLLPQAGSTPMHSAACKGHLKGVAMLLGADAPWMPLSSTINSTGAIDGDDGWGGTSDGGCKVDRLICTLMEAEGSSAALQLQRPLATDCAAGVKPC